MSIQNLQGLTNLSTKCLRTFQQVEQFRVIHLQKHTGDLTSKFGLSCMNERVQAFSNHVLLLFGRSAGKCGRGELLIGCRWSLGRRRLLHASWTTLWRRRSTGIACLLVEFNGGLACHSGSTAHSSTSSGRSTSTTASRTASTSSGSTTARLSGHHAVAWHGVSTRSSRLALHDISTPSGHHLRAHGVGRLHTSRSRTSWHVHAWSTGVAAHRTSHWTTHGASHHSRLAGGISTALVVLSLQLCPTDITTLRQGNKDGLSSNKLSIHLIHGTGRILGRRVANESKSTRHTRLEILHNTSTGNCSHGGELITQDIISDRVFQVLDVKIHTLEFGNTLHLLRLVLLTELTLTFCLLLSTANKQGLGSSLTVFGGLELFLIHFLHGLSGGFVLDKVDESKPKRFWLV
mmetsp:Transcript_18281/g.27277  ORF Transcript_18281/g.27277 Transcript_18281/m.27277 type:complete len:404 (+) Transcript_18281:122-1333(+)